MKKFLLTFIWIIISLQLLFNWITTAYYSSNEILHPNVAFMNKQHPTTNEKRVDSFVKSIMDNLSKKIIKILYSKRFFYINKYWQKKGYINYINYLKKIQTIIWKLMNNNKYRKYKQDLMNIYFTMRDFIKIVKFDYPVKNTNNIITVNKINNKIKDNDSGQSNTVDFSNMPEIKLKKWIENDYKIENLMYKDIQEYNKDYKETWSNIENKYPTILKNFINYITKVINNKIDDKSELQTILENNKKKYSKKNTKYNYSLPQIDNKALQKTINNMKNWQTFLSAKSFQILIDQSKKAKRNIKNIIKEVLNQNINRLILLKKNKNGSFYFWDKLKIYVSTKHNKCLLGRNFYSNTERGRQELIRKEAWYSHDYFLFYYRNYIGNLWVIYYKKSRYCIEHLMDNFNISLPTKNNRVKRDILAKLWAKYLLNMYRGCLLFNNKLFLLIKWNESPEVYSNRDLFENSNIDPKSPYIKLYKKIILEDNYDTYIDKYKTRYHFLYLWEKWLFIHNLYTYTFMLDYLNKRNTLSGVTKDLNLNRINPTKLEQIWRSYENVILQIYKIIKNNNFRTIKDIYKYVTTNYQYDYVLMKKKTRRGTTIGHMLATKKGICLQNSLLLSLLSSIYGIPSGHIGINFFRRYWLWHAVSLINGVIYDPTYDIGETTTNWIWKTFITTNPIYKGYIKDIDIYYPKKELIFINKQDKLFRLKTNYNPEHP